MSSSKRAAPIDLEAGDAGDVAAGKTIAVVATGGQLTVAHREEVVETGGWSKRGHNSREKSTGYHNRPRRGLEFDYLDIGYVGGAVRLHNRQVCNPAMRIGRSWMPACPGLRRLSCRALPTSEHEISLRHRQNFGWLADEKLAVGAHFVCLGVNFYERHGIVQNHVFFANPTTVFDGNRVALKPKSLRNSGVLSSPAYEGNRATLNRAPHASKHRA